MGEPQRIGDLLDETVRELKRRQDENEKKENK